VNLFSFTSVLCCGVLRCVAVPLHPVNHVYSIIRCNSLNVVEATEPSNVLSIRTNVFDV